MSRVTKLCFCCRPSCGARDRRAATPAAYDGHSAGCRVERTRARFVVLVADSCSVFSRETLISAKLLGTLLMGARKGSEEKAPRSIPEQPGTRLRMFRSTEFQSFTEASQIRCGAICSRTPLRGPLTVEAAASPPRAAQPWPQRDRASGAAPSSCGSILHSTATLQGSCHGVTDHCGSTPQLHLEVKMFLNVASSVGLQTNGANTHEAVLGLLREQGPRLAAPKRKRTPTGTGFRSLTGTRHSHSGSFLSTAQA